MSGQFIFAALTLFLAMTVTSGLWRAVFIYQPEHGVVQFYRLVFCILTAALSFAFLSQIWAGNFGHAMTIGVSAAFVLFVIFAWGRLTLMGLKLVATHKM
jgi:hypothetical protein